MVFFSVLACKADRRWRRRYRREEAEEKEERRRQAGGQAGGETQGSGVPHRDESEAEIRVE